MSGFTKGKVSEPWFSLGSLYELMQQPAGWAFICNKRLWSLVCTFISPESGFNGIVVSVLNSTQFEQLYNRKKSLEVDIMIVKIMQL